MTALSFVWVHPYSQNSRCDTSMSICFKTRKNLYSDLETAQQIMKWYNQPNFTTICSCSS